MTAIFPFAMASCCLYPTLLAAGEVVDLAISEKQGIFQLALEMILDASPEDVHYVITDYFHIYRIDPSIVESEVLGIVSHPYQDDDESDDSGVVLDTRLSRPRLLHKVARLTDSLRHG
jgi:hypothetical protein